MDGLTSDIGGRNVLNTVTFQISDGERVGLVGENGSGKSTLLKIIAGELEPDHGECLWEIRKTWGYLPQTFEPVGHLSAATWIEMAVKEQNDLAVRMDALTHQMAGVHGVYLENLLDTYGEVAQQFEQRGGYELPVRIETILNGLGVAHIDRHRLLSQLSGGERVRFGLAAVLIRSPQLLLLDEPTNHLDEAALDWLEHYLAAYSGAMLTASHDRWFLNNTATRILEIDEWDHKIRGYPGNYDAYLKQKQLERLKWQMQYSAEQAQIHHFTQRIAQAPSRVGHHGGPKDHNKMAYRGHGARVQKTVGRKIQAAQAQLDKLSEEAVCKPPEPLHIDLHFGHAMPAADAWLALQDLSAVTEAGNLMFSHVDLTVRYHKRLLVTGPNGQGKSTLLDIIAGHRLPDGGQVQLSDQCVVGYLRQDLVCAHPQRPALEIFREGLEGTAEEHTAQLLSYQLLRAEEISQPYGTLSPGQQRKMMIARLMASHATILLLDEPTNHISFAVLEEFESALNAFPGPIMAVSHDRRFIARFGAPVWILANGRLTLSHNPRFH